LALLERFAEAEQEAQRLVAEAHDRARDVRETAARGLEDELSKLRLEAEQIRARERENVVRAARQESERAREAARGHEEGLVQEVLDLLLPGGGAEGRA
jgi:vacuolar-type H+-ATPase subunit H